jgi:hypothetical protein
MMIDKITAKIEILKEKHKKCAFNAVDGWRWTDHLQTIPVICLFIVIATVFPFSFITIPLLLLTWLVKSPDIRRRYWQRKATKLKQQITALE